MWLPLERYLNHHDQHIRQREGYLIIDDRLSITIDSDVVMIEGRITCINGMFVDVRKSLDINDRHEVCGFSYRYQACIQTSEGIRHIFRYDNSDIKPGHADSYHKHIHDPMESEERDVRVEWIGLRDWPTLGDVLDVLYVWWRETGQYLDVTE